jgi:hypothetical protein
MEDDLKKKMEDDLKKKMEYDLKKQFLIPLKFRGNLSWDWLSSLRFFLLLFFG